MIAVVYLHRRAVSAAARACCDAMLDPRDGCHDEIVREAVPWLLVARAAFGNRHAERLQQRCALQQLQELAVAPRNPDAGNRIASEPQCLEVRRQPARQLPQKVALEIDESDVRRRRPRPVGQPFQPVVREL